MRMRSLDLGSCIMMRNPVVSMKPKGLKFALNTDKHDRLSNYWELNRNAKGFAVIMVVVKIPTILS